MSPVAEDAPQYPVAEDAPQFPVAEDAPQFPVAEDAPLSPVAEDVPLSPVAEDAPQYPSESASGFTLSFVYSIAASTNPAILSFAPILIFVDATLVSSDFFESFPLCSTS